MKVIFCTVFLTLFLVFACAAQQQTACRSAAAKDAPGLFGLKLEMSPVAARSVLGKGLKIKNKRSGEYTFFENFIEKPAPVSLAGARAIYLRFFEGSLYQIEIFYADETRDGAAAPQGLEKFINRQSAKLNLP
ncbi:MAG TPA: hypothetical protein VK400_15085, partial [Pyrinomonadaceae bacterium]|nr:hypothetical protein [Pyrinomonadaceae bacterium]